MNTHIKSAFLAASMLAGSASFALAQDATPAPATAQPSVTIADDWAFSGAIYGWISTIESETASGDSLTVSFSDILDTLEMTFMGAIAAEKDRFLLFSDLIYLKQGSSDRVTTDIGGTPTKVKTDVEIKTWINTSGLAYSVMDDGNTQIYGLGGVRYLRLDAELDLDAGGAGRRLSQKEDFVDGVVGIRGKTDLSDDWYMTYYADIGTGQSDLTYQLFAGVNYRFNNWDAVLGYRYMNWDLGNSGLINELTTKGPMIGARFRF